MAEEAGDGAEGMGRGRLNVGSLFRRAPPFFFIIPMTVVGRLRVGVLAGFAVVVGGSGGVGGAGGAEVDASEGVVRPPLRRCKPISGLNLVPDLVSILSDAL